MSLLLSELLNVKTSNWIAGSCAAQLSCVPAFLAKQVKSNFFHILPAQTADINGLFVIWLSTMLLALLALWHFRRTSNPMTASRKGKQYTVRLQNQPDKEAVYADPDAFPEVKDPEAQEIRSFTTLYNGFYYGWERSQKLGDCRLLGYRKNGEGPYKWIDYKQTERLATNIGSALVGHGLSKGQMVGIYSRTRVEWILTFLGCQFQSLVVVPLYDTLGDDSIVHILNQTKLEVVFVSLPSEAKKIISMHNVASSVKHIIVYEWPNRDEDTQKTVGEWEKFITDEVVPLGIVCEDYKSFILKGEKAPLPHNAPGPDDMFEICYTSGTTGQPKGAIYRHSRLVSEIHALKAYIEIYLDNKSFEVALCYLPLAHSYELAIECFCLMYGFKLGYFNGNPRKILDDIQVLHPTILATVPRVLSRIYQGIEKKTSRQEAGLVRSVLFRLAVRHKIAAMDKGNTHETVLDKLFFKQIHKLLGGQLKVMFVGSSATHPRTLKMLRATLGCHVCEGYGQTESYGVSLVQHPDDTSVRCIGVPLRHLCIKVVDIPELNYFSANNEGELCLKGRSTIEGYYMSAEQTASAIDADGWLHTGDVAKINPNGTVSIIDRIKDVFKLAQGEYVIPEKVESAYKQVREIENILVFGDSLKTCCVAVVFPNTDVLNESLTNARITFDKSNYNKSKHVKDYIMKLMEAAATEADLKGFEKAKNIYISNVPITDNPDLLTPTMKFKRHACAKFFEREIAVMYEGVVDKPL